MMALMRRLLGSHPTPVTFRDVKPAPRDPAKELEIKRAQEELVQEALKVGRRSWEIRQELAGNALSIVSGERP